MESTPKVVSAIREVPVTEERPPPPAEKLEAALGDAGQPRANRAVTVEKPEGTPESPDSRTVLQQHVDFFDVNKDGKISPWETYLGFRRIGLGRVLSVLAAFLINGSMSYPSQNSWLPDPTFSINTAYIHRAKHGSDSETYDTEGRMVPQKMEEIFSKYGDGDTLTGRQVWDATQGNRNTMDPFGWTAAKLEWGITWYLLHDDDGKLSKESVRSCIDGSVFTKLENKRSAQLASKATLAGKAKEGISEVKKKLSQSTASPKQDADISSPLLNGH